MDILSHIIPEIKRSLYNSFIDKSHKAGKYPTQLLSNNENSDVLTELIEELQTCKEFMFSVAFITESGLATIKSHLLDLKDKGVRGRIITSDYLQFNSPKVFKELLKLENVEVKITNVDGFHAKGYIFKHSTYASLIVGSSNLTANALKQNYEWNLYFTSHENGKVIKDFNDQFENIWHTSTILDENWIDEYSHNYIPQLSNTRNQHVAEDREDYVVPKSLIEPNKMQTLALQSIQNVRDQGNERGLVISATGTGKTYLSAFDVQQFNPKRVLFIAHREQILRKSLDDFHRILGGDYNEYGILSGNTKDMSATYLFATIQTISKQDILTEFSPESFDYIIIDEVHRSGAASYRKVIKYFSPEFLLGMTATPDRTDKFNVYELFHYNIAYEIRLQEALEEKMLCPFHYFGVVDIEIDNKTTTKTSIFNQLTSDARVEHILEKARYYGYSGKKLKGLVFCSRKEEAYELSNKFNERGLKTVVLTGENSLEEREEKISKLESGILHYIFTVDVFNEGIDIPKINQIIMLRPTKSSIVFIQQLGRGLRKAKTKEYLTVIDFIGNYKNNYLIPVALSGDGSMNKSVLIRKMQSNNYINGSSSVNFEYVAKERIYKALRSSNLTYKKTLKDAFEKLEMKINRLPKLIDFIVYNSIDPLIIIDRFKTYPNFLNEINKETPKFDDYQLKILEMISIEFLNGKRIQEVILLELLLNNNVISLSKYIDELKCYGALHDHSTIHSVERVLSLRFFTETDKKKYGNLPLITIEKNNYRLNSKLRRFLLDDKIFADFYVDLLKVAKCKNKKFDSNFLLTLYEEYSRKDVCRLLNWENDESGTIFGYKSKHDSCPMFITYHKEDSNIDYEDEFLSNEMLHWYSKRNRTLKSNDVKEIINSQDKNIDIHVFVQRDNSAGKYFYYLGRANPLQESVEEGRMLNEKNRKLPVVKMNLHMESFVENKLYRYITEEPYEKVDELDF